VKKHGEPNGTAKAGRSKGDEIVAGLHELIDVLRSGEPLESRFTVRTYKIASPPSYDGEGVRRVRQVLAMSQAAFAAFLGADASTVRSWEQGLRAPSPLACRLLSEIEAEPAHWRRRLAACVVGPETHGPGRRDGGRARRGSRGRTTKKRPTRAGLGS
jgi:DNA-binding transcriptional regulator YiaG